MRTKSHGMLHQGSRRALGGQTGTISSTLVAIHHHVVPPASFAPPVSSSSFFDGSCTEVTPVTVRHPGRGRSDVRARPTLREPGLAPALYELTTG